MNDERLTRIFLVLSGILALLIVGVNLLDRPVDLTPSGKEYGDFTVVSQEEHDAAVQNGEGETAAQQTLPTPTKSIASSAVVNVNTATKEELITLNGIGEVLAERIIRERQLLPFENAEDLQRVKGIGPKTVEKLQGSITF